jgi:hypothetical protein
LARRLDGGSDELRGLRVDDNAPAGSTWRTTCPACRGASCGSAAISSRSQRGVVLTEQGQRAAELRHRLLERRKDITRGIPHHEQQSPGSGDCCYPLFPVDRGPDIRHYVSGQCFPIRSLSTSPKAVAYSGTPPLVKP